MVHSGSLVYGFAMEKFYLKNNEMNCANCRFDEYSKGKKTPLQVSLDQFSQNVLVASIMIICAVVFALSIYRHMSILDAMMLQLHWQ